MKSYQSDSQHEVNVAVVLVVVEFVFSFFSAKIVTWFFSLSLSAIVLQLFSYYEALLHDIVVAVLLSYISLPPGFFGGRSSTYSPLFILSLLLQLFVLISLLSWPFEPSSSSLLFSPPLLNVLLLLVSIRSWIYLFEGFDNTVFIPTDAEYNKYNNYNIIPLTRS